MVFPPSPFISLVLFETTGRSYLESVELGTNVLTLAYLGSFLEMSDLDTVALALLAFWLDYCNDLYVELPLKSVWKL